MLACTTRWIAITSHVLNAASIICLVVSLATNQWIMTTERIPEVASSPSFALTSSGIVQRNFTYRNRTAASGMWRYCTDDRDPNQPADCFWIEHQFPDHSMVDARNATTCVVYATMVSMPSLISAAAVTLLGMVTNVLIKFRKIWIFVTGIIYIIAGILTFTCLVLYITYVIQELEHKHDEKDEAGDKIFSHKYGYSIIFAMVSFCTQELGGISLIYYAIYRFKQHWEQKDRQFVERNREIQLNEIRFPSASFHLERAAPFMADSNHRSYYTSLEQIERLPLHSVHSRWDGSLPPGQRSVPNCSPKLKRKSMTVPDLDVRTRDVYIGNHLNCSYNSTYRTPFGLDVSRAPSGNRGVPNPRGRLPRQVTFSDDELDVIRVEGGVQFSRHDYLPELVYAQQVRRQRPLRTASLRMTPV